MITKRTLGPSGTGTPARKGRTPRNNPDRRTKASSRRGTGREPSKARQRTPAPPNRRNRHLAVVAAAIICVFVARLVQVQVFLAPGLAARALEGRMTTVLVPAHRGQIVDRNGVVLATSVDRYTIAADQYAILGFRGEGRLDADDEPVADGALGVAQLLAPVLEQDRAELAARLNGTNRYVVLARDVSPDLQREIRALRLSAWIRTELTSLRTYPSGNIAGPLLGFVNLDQQGQGGIELAFDDLLAGKPGHESFERGRDGVPIPGGARSESQAMTGGDVVLTIELDIQQKAQLAIDTQVARTGADFGIVIVKDNWTGELLAIADSGSVNPNDRTTAAVARGSRAVQDIFEPGSTAKVITLAAALEGGYVTPETQFWAPYEYTPPGTDFVFQDAEDHPDWPLTATGVLAKSSNTGTVQIARLMTLEYLHSFYGPFGLGEYTGLNLPGESRGIIHSPEQTDGRSRYALSFGQNMATNAMQATNVFATVANGGVRTPSILIRGTRAANSDILQAPAREEGVRVISEETASTLMRMLEQATSDDGTASAARIPGYRVAGKTGTSQIFEDNGRITILASFIGVAPADNPRFTVSVFLKSPRTSIWGGVVAAPVFRDVMGFVLQQQGVPPSESATNLPPIWWAEPAR